MKNKKGLIVLVAMLGIVLITAGATYAWFSYSKSGAKENTITTGSIKFHYAEGSRTIDVDDMMPMTDAQGKAQDDYFEFTITSDTSRTLDIPYYITARRTNSSDANMDSIVKVYLTKVDNNGDETQVLLSKFSGLSGYSNSAINIPASEKTLYNDTVLAGTTGYIQKYRLRMWIDYDANYITQTPVEAYCTENTNNTTVTEIEGASATISNCVGPDYTWHPADTTNNYPLEGKSYALMVNVYGEGNDIGTTEANYRSSTEITELTVGNTTLTSTDGVNYSEEITMVDETVTKSIEIETENPEATVTVENLTPTAVVVEDSGIRRMSANVSIPLEIRIGTNTFKITVTSANKLDTKVYSLIITASLPPIATDFATDSWETIIYNIRNHPQEAISAYSPKSGGPDAQSMKTIDMGTLGTHKLRVANVNACTNGEASQTACGFVIEFADIITNYKMNNSDTNVGGYPASLLYTSGLMTNIYNALPNEIRPYVITTTVIAGHGSESGEGNFTLNNQYVYLLDRKEVFGDTQVSSAASTTRQLDYYSLSSNYTQRVKKQGNTEKEWWLRSPNSGTSQHFHCVRTTDNTYSGLTQVASSNYGISPAFRIG